MNTALEPKPSADVAPESAGLWKIAWRQLRRKRMAMACLGILAVYIVAWLYAEVVYWRPRIHNQFNKNTSPITPSYKHSDYERRNRPPDWACSLASDLYGCADIQREKTAAKTAWAELDKLGLANQATRAKTDEATRKKLEAAGHTALLAKAYGYQWRWFGTNFAGRDNLQQLLQGTRIAFEIAILTSLLVIPFGFVMGAMAGYFGRRTDSSVVYVYSVVDSIPSLLLIMVIAYVMRNAIDGSASLQDFNRFFDSGLVAVCIGMAFTGWVGLCRLIRAEYMKHRDRQYVLAARSLGASHASVMFRHIAPNVSHLIIINFSLRFPGLILTEALLSYLGVGIASEPSWGAIINDAKQRLYLGNWWELAGATLAMFFLVLALNLFGDALRDALDPKLRTAEGRTG